MNDEKKELYADIDDYFDKSKKEFWIGLQNFQGIREYTKIPLAPLTLLYGQNSAGKSTIHDAQQFIYGYFSGEWKSKKIAEYLDRWANNRRISEPLAKGYLGDFDDVVFSISAATGFHDFLDWQSTSQQNQDFEKGAAYILFGSSCWHGNDIPFRIDVHFSNNLDEWSVRKYTLYFCEKVFIEFIFDDKETESESILVKINKQHLVYSIIDSSFKLDYGEGLEEVSIFYTNIENEIDGWFLYKDITIGNRLDLKRILDWTEEDGDFNVPPSKEVLEFRTFILSLLHVPAIAVARSFNFNSVPPLRPIPSSDGAVFRRHSIIDKKLSDWSLIAEQVCLKLINDNYPIKCDDDNSPDEYQLDKINRILSHPLFLNTDFEITGECQFLAPIGVLKDLNKTNEEMRSHLMKLDAEIHLKLQHKSLGWLTEIEDVGVGISQIIPVLVAISKPNRGHRSYKYSVFIQQPELHLHPRLQAQLADAFIECVNEKMESFSASPCFIVESHSEHFLLRLLRRIRETSKSDIKNKLFSLSPEHVSVLYVDKLEDGSSKIFPLRISPDGEFIDRWPNGFFTERDGELFDE